VGSSPVASSTPAIRTTRARELIGRWFTSYGMLLGILVVVLWDMVFKPGGL
jgi:hypothetical protein